MSLRDQTLARLRRHRVPAWWSDAKFGIFLHWTPASVPAFAPVDDEIGEMLQSGRRDTFSYSPYSEWYENSLRFPDSPVARHHRETYGSRSYQSFASDWEAGLEQWEPEEWAAQFAAAGAKYVVFVSKHHDGYCLWPTDVPNPNRPGWNCKRDVVGEMAEAVRAAGMRFGLYYSGGLDWTFEDRPIGSLADMLAAIPRGDYPAYADAHVRELIDRYRPSVLWNDIAWPSDGKSLWPLLAHYYEQVPDGVVNDRWMPWNPALGLTKLSPVKRVIDAGVVRQAKRDAGIIPPKPPFFDVRTPEYAVFPDVQRHPWECVRGMDKSFGHNRESLPEHFIARDELLWSLVDITSKGGNLLLNVGPRGEDAQIADAQRDRLTWLAEWMKINSSALVATRPWVVPEGTTAEGLSVRYTARDDAVYAFLAGTEPDIDRGSITLREVIGTPTTRVETIDGDALSWRESDRGLVIDFPSSHRLGPVCIVMRNVGARQ